jgi:3-methyladenine DNA glycosylase Tag
MISFQTIRARAEARKGGAEALARLLPPRPDAEALAALTDDRVLAEMAKRVFSAGFAWSVIEAKWPGFEAAFLGFDPARLNFQPDEFWDGLTADTRIVRNGAKIMSVRANAAFVTNIAREHGSFGKFLAAWPSSDEVGLLELLAKRGGRLGGNTGQMLLRFLGWDGFVASRDVVACLREAGLDVAEELKSKRDLAKAQAQFNAWAEETGLPYATLSRICALSIGENYAAHERRGFADEAG